MPCDQCGTICRTHDLTPTDYGDLCPQCAHRQAERSEYGHGLSAGSFGFLSETE
jgi:hypothetical protein